MSSQTPCGGPSTGHTGLCAISLGRAQLAEQRRLLLEERRLQRHERHEAARLRVVQRGEAVLIDGVHVDLSDAEQLDHFLLPLAHGVVQRGAAADLLRVVDQRDHVDVGAGLVEHAGSARRLRFRRAAGDHGMDRRLPVGHVDRGVGAVLQQQLHHLDVAVVGRANERRGAARVRGAGRFAGLKNSCMFGLAPRSRSILTIAVPVGLVHRIDRRAAAAVEAGAQVDAP